MHVENDIINVSPIIKNRNFYPGKENNCGNDYIMIILYDDHLGDTIISGNIDLSENIMMESRYLVLSSLKIGLHTSDTKYRI